MVTICQRQVSITVLFAITLHLFWASCLLIDLAPLGVNAINALHRFIQPPPLLVATLVGVALLAGIGIFHRNRWAVLLLVPQQAILFMSAYGGVQSAWLGQFADGVLRPHTFIASDQIYSVLLAIFHTVAIIAHAMRPEQ